MSTNPGTQREVVGVGVKTENVRDIMPSSLTQIRRGEVRIYFAVPTHYDIGATYATYREAVDAARSKIKKFDYPGQTPNHSHSREWVDVRIADHTGDRMIQRVEVFIDNREKADETAAVTNTSRISIDVEAVLNALPSELRLAIAKAVHP